MAEPRAQTFLATIYRIWMMRHVDVPEEVSYALASQIRGIAQRGAQHLEAKKGSKPKYIPVVAIVNGKSARTTMVPAGAGLYRLQINTAQRKAAQADAGDVIRVELRLDQASRELAVPPDLRAGLKDHPKAWKSFEALPPGQRRQFIRWFDSAKALETRRKRLDRAIEVLLERAMLSPRKSSPKTPNA